jgi:cell division protein FtsA
MAINLKSGDEVTNAVGLLDVGTSKTVCLIVAPMAAGLSGRTPVAPRVLGAGCVPSRGLKAGVVMELDPAEQSVRSAVAEAEQMSGVSLNEVFVAVACGRLKSSTFAATTRIDAGVVREADVERVIAAGRTYAQREGRTLLHLNCIAYRLDGAAGVADPRGIAGYRLGADLHAVTADDAPLRNLLHVIERAYLRVAGIVPSPLACGLAAASEEERRLAVLCVDIGAGATTLALFGGGHLLFTEVIPVGGNHLSFDIARALSAPFVEAERIKQLYGRVGASAADDHEAVSFTLAGEEMPSLCQTTRARVREIVSSRITGLLGQVAERVKRSQFGRYAPQRTVLAGGTSLLPGLPEFAAEIFGRPVRVAHLGSRSGLPAHFCSPAFATALGLAQVPFDPACRAALNPFGVEPAGYLRRVGQWLRESF